MVRNAHSPKSLSEAIRRHALHMTNRAKSSHVGSVFSCADILGVLYAEVLRVDPARPRWAGRDRFILSKGHAGAGVYAALAEVGFFPPAELDTYYQNGSILSGHVSHKDVPGVELSTGSLGHGLPVATGMAMAGKLDGASHRIFVLMSDGECNEGSNWEAIHFAGHHQLANLVAIVDYNKIQSLDRTEVTLGLEPFEEKWRSFRWDVVRVDGHDHEAIAVALESQASRNRPRVVLADTIKGKGVSFMEETVLWHYRSPQGDEFDAALAELDTGGTA